MEYLFSNNNQNCVRVAPIEVGLKVICNKETLDSIVKGKYVKDNLTLNVVKLEDNLFSVYVAEKTQSKEIKWC